HPAAVEFTLFTFIVLLASVSVKLWMMNFFGALGRKIRSTTLKATSVDSRNDVIASSAVMLGCLAQYFFHIRIDGIIGLAVALFILYSGVNIARETISPLLGKQADAELIDNLSRLVLSSEKVLGIHDLLVHDYGPGQCYATVHAEVSAEEDPLACHDMIDAIESEAMEKLRVNLVIHYDPVVLDDEERNAALDVVTEVITGIHPDLSIHDFRLVRGAHRTKLIFDLAVPYDMETPHKELKERIDAGLKEKGLDYETIVHFDGKA
ncbi:MAG: cation diffusion facilitator family transporter, partial [Clostridia bacterium]